MARAGVLSFFVLLTASALVAQPQIGGGTCSNSTMTGQYFWLLSGGIATGGGGATAAAEIAEFVANGNGAFSGVAITSTGSTPVNRSISGTYAIAANCTGTFILSYNGQPSVQTVFQVVNGRDGLIAFSTPTGILTGIIRSQSADQSTPCNNGSFSGSYGYLATGTIANQIESDSGTFSSDGNGNVTGRSTANLGGAVSTEIATGTYSVNSNCTGQMTLTNQNGSAVNLLFAIAGDGTSVPIMRSDPNTVFSGIAIPQSSAPQQAVVNSASFAPRRLAPGSLFSIFGQGFSQQTASATQLPLPTTLASTQVLINGKPVPLDYVSPAQINAQAPLETPVNAPITISVVSAGKQSNSAALSTLSAAPGIFTYGQNQAVVQNRDLSVNSPTHPAHPGDVVVAYLTGGGAVNASGSWVTGGASPGGPSPVTSSYSIAVGGQQAQGTYLGLTPGFVGLYQANIKVPQVASGNYPLSITVNGVESNGPVISVSN